MLAPARIPVAAGKKMAKTEKKPSPFVKLGPKFSANIDAEMEVRETSLSWVFHHRRSLRFLTSVFISGNRSLELQQSHFETVALSF